MNSCLSHSVYTFRNCCFLLPARLSLAWRNRLAAHHTWFLPMPLVHSQLLPTYLSSPSCLHLTFLSLFTKLAVSSSSGNACCCLQLVSSDTPSLQLSASNYILWLHELSAPSLHGLHLFSGSLCLTKLKPDTVPTVPHALLSGCPHTTPVSTAMSFLPHWSPSSVLDDEFSANLEH